jgi:hypothetical protein
MNKKANYIFVAALLFFSALIAPLALIPVEKILPFPYIIEEILKAILVLFILKLSPKSFQIKLALFIGFLFAFSENFFYLPSFIENGNLDLFFQRFFLTSFLHILTILIILISSQKRRYLIFPAAILAMIVHYFYNQLIVFLIK